MSVHAYCICTTVGAKSLQALLEASGRGRYRDEHPWLVAREMLTRATQLEERLPILFATGQPSEFSHWGFLEAIDVHELHRGQWETRCTFTPLEPVNSIWSSLDSVFLNPGAEQLHRESVEGIHQHRYALGEGEIHPYAICETPAFILTVAQPA
jgi:hypothetical protein